MWEWLRGNEGVCAHGAREVKVTAGQKLGRSGATDRLANV
jgi:hypothetical protein